MNANAIWMRSTATAIVWGAARFHTNNSKDFGPHIIEIEIVLN